MPARDPGRCRLADVVYEINEEPSRFLAFAPALTLPRIQIVDALNRRIQELQEHSEPDANIQERREINPSGGRTRYLIWRNGTWHQSDQPYHGASTG